jgi:hypothetical protein
VLALLTVARQGQTKMFVHSPFPKERAAGCTAYWNDYPDHNSGQPTASTVSVSQNA